jgi:hypothetical protein
MTKIKMPGEKRAIASIVEKSHHFIQKLKLQQYPVKSFKFYFLINLFE